MNEQFEKWFEELDILDKTQENYSKDPFAMLIKHIAELAWQSSRESLWQTMDSAPMDDNNPIFILASDGEIFQDCYFHSDKNKWVCYYCCYDYEFDKSNATHWMIPVLPKQDV